MGLLVALGQAGDGLQGHRFGWAVVGLLLLEAQQEVLREHHPPPTSPHFYLRQLLRKRDSFCKKPSKTMQVSSCLSAFELRAIHLISLIISA